MNWHIRVGSWILLIAGWIALLSGHVWFGLFYGAVALGGFVSIISKEKDDD